MEGFSVFGAILQSFISSFYTVVMFHMMGYMIYQYQSSLGFSARDDSFTRTVRSDAQKRQANIKALLREAKFEEVSKLYASECKQNRGDAALYKECFKYLLAIKDTKNLAAFGNSYLKLLIETSRFEEARLTYKQLINDIPTFQLTSAHVRHTLAKSFHEVNDSLLAVKIIHGMHKEHADFEELPEAYAFCADILDTMQGRQKAANDFRRYSQKLAQERTQQAQQRADNLNSMLVAKNSPVAEQKQQTPQDSHLNSNASGGLSLVPMEEH